MLWCKVGVPSTRMGRTFSTLVIQERGLRRESPNAGHSCGDTTRGQLCRLTRMCPYYTYHTAACRRWPRRPITVELASAGPETGIANTNLRSFMTFSEDLEAATQLLYIPRILLHSQAMRERGWHLQSLPSVCCRKTCAQMKILFHPITYTKV